MANTPSKKCFVVSPIGKKDDEIRVSADFFLEDIVRAALTDEYEIKRADDYNKAGNITSQVIQAISKADLIIADLSRKNPNVYYELGVAHSYQRHVVPMKDVADTEPIPFDNYGERTIPYSLGTVGARKEARLALQAAVKETIAAPVSNPVTAALGLEREAAKGDSRDQILQNLSEQVAQLSRSAHVLEASTEATKTLIKTERPYVTGGGGFKKMKNGQKVLFVDVANYGKTPALLTHYDVQFTTLKRVKAAPPLKVKPRFKHYDWLPTVGQKTIKAIRIPAGKDVVFGGFWYLDFQRQEHCFRFILTIDQHTTHPNIADEVDASYTYWD